MILLGIDPGLHLTGYALVQVQQVRISLIEAGVFRIPVRKLLADRLLELHDQLEAVLTEFSPQQAGVEQLYSHYEHPRTAILMGHARGVILLAAARHHCPVTDLPSTLVKRTVTGNGHASKLQVQRRVQSLCHLTELPKPPDVADAIAIAWTLALHQTRAGLGRTKNT
ncbi:MAG: crossover junction endodeoxyribonuclease RuvC [Phycisphaerae bacterium]